MEIIFLLSDEIMKKIPFVLVGLFLLNGCSLLPKPYKSADIPLYSDATGDTAMLRVIGFNDYTKIRQIESCSVTRNLGFLRDYRHEERNPSRVVDKGFKKAVPPPENVPLDYQERIIPAQGWLVVESTLFASDGGICTLSTNWFKPEKNALYEVRNRLNKAGNICSMEFVQVDQETGKTKRIVAHEKVAEFLPCETIAR